MCFNAVSEEELEVITPLQQEVWIFTPCSSKRSLSSLEKCLYLNYGKIISVISFKKFKIAENKKGFQIQ